MDYYSISSNEQGIPTLHDNTHADGLLRDAKEFAVLATHYDGEQQYKTALFYYVEAIQAIYNAALANPELNLSEKYTEYVQRVRSLQTHLKQGKPSSGTEASKSEDQIKLERARFLLNQAFAEDEEGNKEEAIELYLNAAELCIKGGRSSSEPQKSKLNKLAKQALDRAEALKSQDVKVPGLPEPPSNHPQEPEETIPDLPLPPRGPLPSFDDDDEADDVATSSSTVSSTQSSSSTATPRAAKGNLIPETGERSGGGGGAAVPEGGGGPSGGGGGKYTADEIQVLRNTSFINGREYVPFISRADLKERFAFPMPFTDKCGPLVLAPKQKERFGRWARPEEFCKDPQIIYAISSFSVRQTIIQDCSFLSSLAISANYERRFKKILISNIIYPQDKKGKPIYNPCGKYMVIFRINGVKRKVIIDDYLPLDKHGQLLCSFSSNHNELWVSLLEKAYMKVMGGYDFPGSNSNIDLHTLTGWIPERVNLRAKDVDKDKTFLMLLQRFHKGDVLVTVATGPMSDEEADRAGLVSTHAYAMLDIREIRGKKLMQLKNPWSHLRWKGNFSEFDKEHWTPELQKELNFDPLNAQQYDNGVFWIDYQSVCRFFDVLYLNWNPALFPRTYVLHSTWMAKEGPKKDVITMGNNPQYRLEVKGPGPVWILLSRHITDKADFADNKEFITLVIFKGGKKVFYPNDPPPYIDGTRINSPHYLCKMLIQDKGTSLYTIIISQFEKSNNIHYSLRVYSPCEFKLSKMPEPYKYHKSITGEWKGKTAGGCANHRGTFQNNPIYQVNLQEKAKANFLMVDLKGPRNFYVGFDVTAVSPEGVGESFDVQRSGEYRRGFTVLQLENMKGGIYNIRPTTFQPGEESPFFLTLSASCPMKVVHLQ